MIEEKNLAVRLGFTLRVFGIALIVTGILALVLGNYLYSAFGHTPCDRIPGVPCSEVEWPSQAGILAFYSGGSAIVIGVALTGASFFTDRKLLQGGKRGSGASPSTSVPANAYNIIGAKAPFPKLGYAQLFWIVITGAGLITLLLALNADFTFTNCHCIVSYGYDFTAELVGIAVMLVGVGGLVGSIRLETILLLRTLGAVLAVSGLLMMLAESSVGPPHSCFVGYPCPMPPLYSHPTTGLLGMSLVVMGLPMYAASYFLRKNFRQTLIKCLQAKENRTRVEQEI